MSLHWQKVGRLVDSLRCFLCRWAGTVAHWEYEQSNYSNSRPFVMWMCKVRAKMQITDKTRQHVSRYYREDRALPACLWVQLSISKSWHAFEIYSECCPNLCRRISVLKSCFRLQYHFYFRECCNASISCVNEENFVGINKTELRTNDDSKQECYSFDAILSPKG